VRVLKIKIKTIDHTIAAVGISMLFIFFIVNVILYFSVFNRRTHANVNPVIVCSFFLKIDYISLWVERYINSGNYIPENKFNFLSALNLLRGNSKEGEIAEISGEFADYVQSLRASSDDSELPVIMANIVLDSAKKQDIDRFYKFYNSERLNFEMGTNQSAINNSDNYKYLYLIFSLENFSLDNQSYAKVLISMRDGYYFQDTKGTLYKEGTKVMVRFKL
jgi:hypothetical protein